MAVNIGRKMARTAGLLGFQTFSDDICHDTASRALRMR